MKKSKRYVFFSLALAGFVLFFTTSCDDSANPPSVTTAEVSGITSTEAASGGNVTADGGDAVIGRGIVWGTSSNPSIEDNEGQRASGSGVGEFTSAMTGLTPGTNYHVRAYATNSEGTSYGENLGFTTDEPEPEYLSPGNWDNATSAVNYNWGAGEGFIFGTNIYNDKAYGQIFNISQSYEIYGAVYWIGVRRGTTGNIDFKIWNYSGGQVGQVLGSKSIPVADITPTVQLADAIYVEFDEPVVVTGNFLIGADFTGMGAYVEGENELGNISSEIGDGLGANLALVLEANDQWVSVGADYNVDVDIAIFPWAMATGKTSAIKSAPIHDRPVPAHLPFVGSSPVSSPRR